MSLPHSFKTEQHKTKKAACLSLSAYDLESAQS